MNEFDKTLEELKRLYYDKHESICVLCPWLACANNNNGECKLDEVEFINVYVDGKQYLECDMFDWE